MSESGTSLGQVAAPRPKLKRMKRQAINAAALMQKYLADGSEDKPSMVEYLADKFYDDSEIVTDRKIIGGEEFDVVRPKVSVKEKTGIAMFFAREANQRAQVARAAGLSKLSGKDTTTNTVLNISINPNLPIEERIKLIQAEVSGVPLVLPASQNVVIQPQTGVASSPAPGAHDPPEIPSAASTGDLSQRIDEL